MTTQVFWRNPEYYIKECLELNESLIAFDRGYLINRSLDPDRWAGLYFGTQEYRVLIVDQNGSPELRLGNAQGNPHAVYPTWSYGDDFNDLEAMCENAIGLDEEACEDKSISTEFRPVLGQEHRVIVTDLPPATAGPVRRVLKLIKELQQDYYECIIHVHGLYGFRSMFNGGYGAVDYDPRTLASKGKVVLGSGKEMTYEQAARVIQWVSLVGARPAELKVPRNRCMFNMKSAKWAAENFTQDVKFKTSGYHQVNPDSAVAIHPTTGNVRTKNLPVLSGDKFLCDTCSLQDTCKYFRVGEVCSIPGSEPSQLARMFKTRDADTIIDGLGSVLAVQTERLQRGAAEEDEYGELDPEVTKIVNSILTHGNKLAKLINPALNGGPKVGVFLNGGSATIAADPKQMVAGLVRELEAQGIDREKITEEMIMRLMAPNDQTAIETKSQAAAEREAM